MTNLTKRLVFIVIAQNRLYRQKMQCQYFSLRMSCVCVNFHVAINCFLQSSVAALGKSFEENLFIITATSLRQCA